LCLPLRLPLCLPLRLPLCLPLRLPPVLLHLSMRPGGLAVMTPWCFLIDQTHKK
jgi:hypothetical protein